jgi:hypothetical protein
MNIDEFLAIAIVGNMMLLPAWYFAAKYIPDRSYYSNDVTHRTWAFWGLLVFSFVIICIAAGVSVTP